MIQLGRGFDGAGQHQSVESERSSEPIHDFRHTIEMPAGLFFRLALKTHLGPHLVFARRFGSPHLTSRENLMVLFDLAHEYREEPRLRSVRENNAVSLVFVESRQQRAEIGFFVPVNTTSYRHLQVSPPRAFFGACVKHDQTPASGLESTHELEVPFRSFGKDLFFDLVGKLGADRTEHIAERDFESASTVRGPTLVYIEINTEHATTRLCLPPQEIVQILS
jgi:hypothetical protein